MLKFFNILILFFLIIFTESSYSIEIRIADSLVVAVEDIVINNTSDFIVSRSYEKIIALWDTDKSNCKFLQGHSAEVKTIAFNNFSKYLISGSWDNTLILWDLESASVRKVFRGHTNILNDLKFAHSGKIVASASDDRSLIIWDLSIYNLMASKSSQMGTNQNISQAEKSLISSSNQFIKLSSSDEKVFREETVLTGHKNSLGSLDFSADDKFIISASNDKSIKIWDVEKAMCKATIVCDKPIAIVKFCSDGIHFVNFSNGDSVLRIRNLNQLDSLKTIKIGSNKITEIGINPVNNTVAVGDKSGKIVIIDIDKNQIIHTLNDSQDGIRALEFSADGKLLAAGGRDKRIFVWNTEKYELKTSFSNHSNFINCLTFFPDNKYLLSGSKDGSVVISDLSNGDKILQLYSLKNNEWIALSGDGRFDCSENAPYSAVFYDKSIEFKADDFTSHNFEKGLIKKLLNK
ncbi:MAG: WD40 repeat domain-containing protein [Candidatus Kapabacteria bacterium]|nr:WD40 repeat domain-containing protein [Candidatus Kapabacteria bacterium]